MHVMVEVSYSVKGFCYKENFGLNVPKAASASRIKQLAAERCKGIVSKKKGCAENQVSPSDVKLIS